MPFIYFFYIAQALADGHGSDSDYKTETQTSNWMEVSSLNVKNEWRERDFDDECAVFPLILSFLCLQWMNEWMNEWMDELMDGVDV